MLKYTGDRVRSTLFSIRCCPGPVTGGEGSAIYSFAFGCDANGNILTSQREDGSWWYHGYDGRGNQTRRRFESCAGGRIFQLRGAAEEGY